MGRPLIGRSAAEAAPRSALKLETVWTLGAYAAGSPIPRVFAHLSSKVNIDPGLAASYHSYFVRFQNAGRGKRIIFPRMALDARRFKRQACSRRLVSFSSPLGQLHPGTSPWLLRSGHHTPPPDGPMIMEDRSGHWEINVEEASRSFSRPKIEPKHMSSPSPAPLLCCSVSCCSRLSWIETRNFTWTPFANLTSRL